MKRARVSLKATNEVETSPGMSPPQSGGRREAEKSAPREPPPAALRALAEAEARRAETKPIPSPELNGRGGLDPARYGDWEVKGLASDF
jgi:hypothetical protein